MVNRRRNSVVDGIALWHVYETRRRRICDTRFGEHGSGGQPLTFHHVISLVSDMDRITIQHALSSKSKNEIQIVQRARDSARMSSLALLSLGRIEQEKEIGRLNRKSPAGPGIRVDSTPADTRDERTLCHRLYMDTSQVPRPCLGPSRR